jgi:RimJ/RimL family protein N-acetyltransferase
MTIETPRLVLEPVTPRNAGVLWKLMQSGHLREYQDVPRYTRDEFQRRVAARPKRLESRAIGRFEWVAAIAESRVGIGWISLRIGDHSRGVAEIGYSIVASHRSKRYASEAACAVIDCAFETSDLRRIDACCVPGNLPSRRLLARLDFVETHLQRHAAVVRGRPVDVCVYEMSRERWLAVRDRLAVDWGRERPEDRAQSAN